MLIKMLTSHEDIEEVLHNKVNIWEQWSSTAPPARGALSMLSVIN